MKSTFKLVWSVKPWKSLALCAIVGATSIAGLQAAAQAPEVLPIPEKLERLSKVGLALSCTGYTRRVAEKAFHS